MSYVAWRRGWLQVRDSWRTTWIRDLETGVDIQQSHSGCQPVNKRDPNAVKWICLIDWDVLIDYDNESCPIGWEGWGVDRWWIGCYY